MDEFVRAAGFKDLISQKRKLSGIIREASESVDARKRLYASDDSRATECFRYCGRSFGLTAYYSKNSGDIMKMRRWVVFAESESDLHINAITVDRGFDGHLYAFCEEEYNGVEFEFRINNIVEYKKNWAKYISKGSPFAVNVAGLASFGTVVLPVAKTEESERAREAERGEYRALLTRERRGDRRAGRRLDRRAAESAREVRDRLKNEDLLSVFEGYLLPIGNEEGVFATLGEIVGADSDFNDVTGERVVKLALDVTGTPLTVYVNQSDLLGMPLPGMRFMGICKLQGTFKF